MNARSVLLLALLSSSPILASDEPSFTLSTAAGECTDLLPEKQAAQIRRVNSLRLAKVLQVQARDVCDQRMTGSYAIPISPTSFAAKPAGWGDGVNCGLKVQVLAKRSFICRR